MTLHRVDRGVVDKRKDFGLAVEGSDIELELRLRPTNQPAMVEELAGVRFDRAEQLATCFFHLKLVLDEQGFNGRSRGRESAH